LREGQRVRVVLEGTVNEFGKIRLPGAGYYISPSQCVSIEPVPVVVEPGKWYCPADNDQSEDYYYYGLPGGSVLCHDGGWAPHSVHKYEGRLVECDPPAEFRDGA
jgi:hypothetical protein